MRNLPFGLVLLCPPMLASAAGQLVLSPVEVTADNQQQTTELVLNYRPGAGVRDMTARYGVDLDRLGWAFVESIPSASPAYVASCHVASGDVVADVRSSTSAYLPAGAAIPLCRIRVRTHAHTPRGYFPIRARTAMEVGQNFPIPDYPATNTVWVYVP
jgi:hypothetical protein